MEVLSEREELVLRTLISAYIAMRDPVGSRTISKKGSLGISPATIRNTVSDLEEKGYVQQPHTSAGRVPTDKGYRFYVDHLMPEEGLTDAEKRRLEEEIIARIREGHVEDILDQVSKIIADVSEQLGLALSPRFEQGLFHKMEMVPLTDRKILLALTITSGLVKTMVIEVDSALSPRELQETCQLLNERLHGLSIGEIRGSMEERVRSTSRGNPKLLRIIADEVEELFSFGHADTLYLGGTGNIFMHPEFTDLEKAASLIELLEHREIFISMLGERADYEGIMITIGRENISEAMHPCSLVTARYKLGDVSGIIGLIGPTRMRYPKLTALLRYTADLTEYLLGI